MDAFITMYSMELLRQQEITDTNMHMEAVMVTEVNTVMETMDMAMGYGYGYGYGYGSRTKKGNEDKTQESKTERQVKKDHE